MHCGSGNFGALHWVWVEEGKRGDFVDLVCIRQPKQMIEDFFFLGVKKGERARAGRTNLKK
jgi:hypothetical protein